MIRSIKALVPYAAGAVCVGAVAVAWLMRLPGGPVLAGNIGLVIGDGGNALVQVPYTRDAERGTVTVALDLDADGTFEPDETVVDAMPSMPRQYDNNNYECALPTALTAERLPVRVTFTSLAGVERSLTTTVRPRYIHGIPVAAVMPDEPAAIAQAMYALAKARWQDNKLPADPLTAAAELADDMRIAAPGTSGIVRGANLWAQKKGLPITTTEVVARGRTDVTATLERTLAAGGAAQIRLDERMATLVALIRADDGVFVEVRYPYEPIGTTVYRLEPSMVRWGLVHSWQ
jgi:hypothetical protein